MGKSICWRDKSVNSHQKARHWKADTVVSDHGKSKACFATLTERKTLFYIAVKMPKQKVETIADFSRPPGPCQLPVDRMSAAVACQKIRFLV